jgi:hypothetical protein
VSEADDTPETSDQKTPIEQAVEHAFDLFVYAPIGILFEGASLLPELIAKGKTHVSTARYVGKFAVEQATKGASTATSKAQDRAAGVISFLGDSIAPIQADTDAATERTPAPRTPRSATAKETTTPRAAVNSTISAASLAIPDYDGLSASQVVNRLAGLSPAELENVQLYEAAHRGRKTILSKVAQLQDR